MQHHVTRFNQSNLNIIIQEIIIWSTPCLTSQYFYTVNNTVFRLILRFNNDPSIDILLLTTHVGGLGLNLTGADTVIFVEHDWNPMKDLQVCQITVTWKSNLSLCGIYYLPRRRRPGTGDIATPPVRPSVCLSVTFSFRTVTQKRIDVFSRNFAGTCTMSWGCAV